MSTENQLATIPAPMFGLSTIQEAVEFSAQMAKANLLPAHLKGSPADCLRVVMQAARWQMDPFAVADKTSVINGKLMHEGQLVSAVVNARGNLSKKLTYVYEGDGDARKLTVIGTIKGEDEPRTIELPFVLAKRINKNGQMLINPDQQAAYIGARLWARKHTPELMLGVYTPDEIDEDQPQNVTGTAPETEAAVVPARPKVERARRGAAAATEPAADPKPETTAATVVTPAAAPAPQTPRQADIAKAAASAVDAELNATPRTSIKDKETLTVIVEIEEFIAKDFGKPEKPKPAVKAKVKGDYNGTVFDMTAKLEDGKVTASPAWSIEGRKKIVLLGAARADAAGKPDLTNVAALVQSIEDVTPAAPKTEEAP